MVTPCQLWHRSISSCAGSPWLNAELSALGTTGGRVWAKLQGPLSLPRQEPASKDRQPGYDPSRECLELSTGLDFSFNQEWETKQNKTPNSTHWCSAVFWILETSQQNLQSFISRVQAGGLLWLTPRELPITPSDQNNTEYSTTVYSFKII